MAFAPFDGILLDDPRDPIPGVVAIQLHHRVERRLALAHGRAPLGSRAIQDRASACQLLLSQGLLPEQLRALQGFGLALGDASDRKSLASLVCHLEGYLEAVSKSAYLEPMAALWEACDALEDGQASFWVERHPEDGPLRADIRDLAPARLRALCALKPLPIVFELSTARGQDERGLFEGGETHLVRTLLPALEEAAGLLELDHLHLASPDLWAQNPWGESLDGLFDGPLHLPEHALPFLQRAETPTPFGTLRCAVEQCAAWVRAGVPPCEITLIHPEVAQVGPMLQAFLAAEGIPMRPFAGPSLKSLAPWGNLSLLLLALRNQDPACYAAAFNTQMESPLGESLRQFASILENWDESGPKAIQQAFHRLSPKSQSWLSERFTFMQSLPEKVQEGGAWAKDLESLAQRLDMAKFDDFYPVYSLLQEGLSEFNEMDFDTFLSCLDSALDLLQSPQSGGEQMGVRLTTPEALESSWQGSQAMLLLDLGEGIWPKSPRRHTDLDIERQLQINGALRAADREFLRTGKAMGTRSLFPASLQCFLLPRCEGTERVPKAFHRAAYGFNRCLALTSKHLVALSAKSDDDGRPRPQGPFWNALEGASTWQVQSDNASSHLRYLWEATKAAPLSLERQEFMNECSLEVPALDLTPGLLTKGQSPENPMAPTFLESLARCPFKTRAEKIWNCSVSKEDDQTQRHLGALCHALLECLLKPFVGEPHWPDAFNQCHGQLDFSAMKDLLNREWNAHQNEWMNTLKTPNQTDLETTTKQRLALFMEQLAPNLAELMLDDLNQNGPKKSESEALQIRSKGPWNRRLMGLEFSIPPLALQLNANSPIWVHGKLDRLERLEPQNDSDSSFLRIIDYKLSSQLRLKEYTQDRSPYGVHLQLPLYQEMVQIYFNQPCSALLLSVKEGWKPVSMTQNASGREELLSSIQALLELTQAGYFPPRPDQHCAHCTLSALCGRAVDLPEGEDGDEA